MYHRNCQLVGLRFEMAALCLALIANPGIIANAEATPHSVLCILCTLQPTPGQLRHFSNCSLQADLTEKTANALALAFMTGSDRLLPSISIRATRAT